ncbi:LacI family DNA-binding transcriptional regulator [Leifsonia sp. Leaf264]|uniref:LacI family DNA-binding transcriptional regulator n=1 Tax=Leifsonia sp. Leaf264 TaxID=1736314 RepID=UPI0012F728F7|nr:LacI family DNA-binding transcriptional regulator [Leifsonia sp. Leaf264]
MTGITGIDDVARAAGVSASTVSRVMNGRAGVDAALVERVRTAATALGYRPNPLARSLVLGRTQTIAVVVPDLANPTFQGMLRGVTLAAARDGYRVLVADTSEDVAAEEAIVRETRRRCDAVVLCSPRMPTDVLTAAVAALDPVVVINRSVPGIPGVSADYRAGIVDLLEHLAALGHRRLVYVAGSPSSASDAARRAGVAAFAQARPDVEVRTVEAGATFGDGAAAASVVIDSGATGVVAFNDLVAMGLLASLAARGVAVPAEMSVVGFDDIPFAAFTTPALTTAAVPVGELGELAWGRLAARFAGEEPEGDVVLRPELRVRESSGPPPAAVGRTARAARTGRS